LITVTVTVTVIGLTAAVPVSNHDSLSSLTMHRTEL
jgi:hypothetical protein